MLASRGATWHAGVSRGLSRAPARGPPQPALGRLPEPRALRPRRRRRLRRRAGRRAPGAQPAPAPRAAGQRRATWRWSRSRRAPARSRRRPCSSTARASRTTTLYTIPPDLLLTNAAGEYVMAGDVAAEGQLKPYLERLAHAPISYRLDLTYADLGRLAGGSDLLVTAAAPFSLQMGGAIRLFNGRFSLPAGQLATVLSAAGKGQTDQATAQDDVLAAALAGAAAVPAARQKAPIDDAGGAADGARHGRRPRPACDARLGPRDRDPPALGRPGLRRPVRLATRPDRHHGADHPQRPLLPRSLHGRGRERLRRPRHRRARRDQARRPQRQPAGGDATPRRSTTPTRRSWPAPRPSAWPIRCVVYSATALSSPAAGCPIRPWSSSSAKTSRQRICSSRERAERASAGPGAHGRATRRRQESPRSCRPRHGRSRRLHRLLRHLERRQHPSGQGHRRRRERGLRAQGVRVARAAGEREAEWILLDYLDLVVHVFTPAARDFYRLEALWRDVPRVPIAADDPDTAD